MREPHGALRALVLVLVLTGLPAGLRGADGPTGKPIAAPQTGPVGAWTVPVPCINPLGSQDLYTGGTSFLAGDSGGALGIRYVANATEFERTLHGDAWTLSVMEPSGLPRAFLEAYASKSGATIVCREFADRLIFTVQQPRALWWCDAVESADGYTLNVLRQTVVAANEEYRVTPAQFGDGMGRKVAFVTVSTGERFQTIRLAFSSGIVRVGAESVVTSGGTDTYLRYDKTLDSRTSHSFILDDLPQGPAILAWTFDPGGTDAPLPEEITFRLEESYPLPAFKPGDEPGSLLVTNAPFGSVQVEPQTYVDVQRTEGSRRDSYGGKQRYEGSLTPEGHTRFTLPSGLWTVVHHAPYMNHGCTKAQLVPVSSGEETTLTLPDSLRSANARLNSMADDGDLTGGIAITQATATTSTAEISLSVSDPHDRDLNPTKANTTVFESGSKVEVTDIRRVVAPCSVALVIDSSGSMKKDMAATLAAAKAFLATLPAKSLVKVVDFDAQVRVLSGETPAAAAAALSSITAGGATKLFDATLRGLELLKGAPRPAVVVFTDGIDSSVDKTGGGSVNPKSAVVDAIKRTKIPVYTIGFGRRLNAEQAKSSVGPVDGVPDVQCLLEFAAAANGQYYPAKDPAALKGVFAAIGSRLGNNFVVTYARPRERNVSATPFISMVVDNSGSMDRAPAEGIDCNFRLQKTLALFHDFVAKLPSDAMLQFTTFQTPAMSPPLIVQHQVTTDRKATILKALGEMNADGGTPVVEALRTAFENILPVPSSRKIIVLLTDGGLEVEPEQTEQFRSLLGQIKERKINVLFVGMGAHSKKALFAAAAAATGGDYVISEDVGELASKLDGLIRTLRDAVPPATVPLTVSIRETTPDGAELHYAVADEVPFALPPKAGPPLAPDLVKTATGKPLPRYAADVAAAVTGLGLPGTDNVVTNRLAFGTTARNRAMALTVKQGVYFSTFQGVPGDATGRQFVALEVELENLTEGRVPYAIPSLFNHFYLGTNGEGLSPASTATWLAARPLSPPGNPEVVVEPGRKTAGVIVFVVPASPGFTQQSLHFWDTVHGHLQLPLTGTAADRWSAVEHLPAAPPVKLSEAFAMKVTAAGLQPSVDRWAAADRSAFRVVEALFESKLQALLSLDPYERIWLKVDTKSGALMGRMSGVTASLPLGFIEPVMLAPGSENRVRLAFDLPRHLSANQSSLYFDLATGRAEIPVSSGAAYGAPKAAATVEGPGLRVIVNQVTALDADLQFTLANGATQNAYGGTVLLDVTLADLPGNEGTRLPEDFFLLVNKSYRPPTGLGVTTGRVGLGGGETTDAEVLKPSADTQALVFGVAADFGVFEGQSRRGVVVFPKPSAPLADWLLQSPYVPGLRVPIGTGAFASPELLGLRRDVPVDRDFERQLDAAVAAAVAASRALGQGDRALPRQVCLDGHDGRESVPMPPIATHGLQTLARTTSEPAVLDLLQSLRCLPLNRDGGYLQSYGYEPEAVVTQGWGDIGDVANLARRLFARLGYQPSVRALALTAAGKKRLQERTGFDLEQTSTVPLGISYVDAAGTRKTYVIPFLQDRSALEGLVYLPSDAQDKNMGILVPSAKVDVLVRYVPGAASGSGAARAGDGASALGGDEGGDGIEELLMLERTLPLPLAGTDAVDLCFMPRLASGKPNCWNAVISWAGGQESGAVVLENPAKVLGIKVVVSQISGVDHPLVHYSTLAEGDTLDRFFQTMALNLPDLTEASAEALDALATAVHDRAANPDPLSIARWYGRNILYGFISGQSMFDQTMVDDLGLVLGRVNRPRCVLVTSRQGQDGTMHTTIDLMQAFNEVHVGEATARQAYSLASGFYMSSLEAAVLPGKNRVGYLDLWAQAPPGTALACIPCLDEGREALHQEMVAKGTFPHLLLEAVKENRHLLFAPTAPTLFEGQKRWAWLQIDPETCQAISVFDTGQRSGMTEFRLSLQPSSDDTVQWMKGIWVGTNVSVWTMCSSSLKYGDSYGQAVVAARKAALAVGKVIEEFFSTAEGLQKMEVGGSIDLGGAGSHAIDVKIGMSGLKGSLKQNMIDLNGGFKLAVETYFRSIVPRPPAGK